MDGNKKIELKRGLRGVYIDRTESTFIDGKAGKLLYRGYNIHDLAEHASFEEVVYLLLYGSLPTVAQLSEFDSQLRAERAIPDEIHRIISLLKNVHPMDALRTAVSALSAFEPEVSDNSREALRRKGLRLTAKAPTIVAAHARVREGKDPVPPDLTLAHTANFLYMLHGERGSDEDAALLDRDFVLHAEHGVNASSFAARVAASTRADFHSAITAAIAVLKGPAHGGAAEEVMKMAAEIGSEENAEPYVKNLIKGRGRVMGFGHRVYRAVDPRSKHLKADTRALGLRKNQPKWFAILEAVSRVMEPYSRKGICENVDFWSGAMYYLLGIPEDLFISIFAMGRIPGWTSQVMEQLGNNILLRPMLHYVGPMDLDYQALEERR